MTSPRRTVGCASGVDLLEEQPRLAQDQIGDAWESVALGLGAEALAHEVQHISDGASRAEQIIQYLKASRVPTSEFGLSSSMFARRQVD